MLTQSHGVFSKERKSFNQLLLITKPFLSGRMRHSTPGQTLGVSFTKERKTKRESKKVTTKNRSIS